MGRRVNPSMARLAAVDIAETATAEPKAGNPDGWNGLERPHTVTAELAAAELAGDLAE